MPAGAVARPPVAAPRAGCLLPWLTFSWPHGPADQGAEWTYSPWSSNAGLSPKWLDDPAGPALAEMPPASATRRHR